MRLAEQPGIRHALIHWEDRIRSPWTEAKQRLLAAVPTDRRAQVARMLSQASYAGRGLRVWLRVLATQSKPLPAHLPALLIDVYLSDSDAMPLAECPACGVALPTRLRWRGIDADPAEAYFAVCPCCDVPAHAQNP